MDAKGDSKEDPVPGGGGDDDGGGDLIDELTSDNDYCDGAPDSDVEVGGDDAAPLPPEFIAARSRMGRERKVLSSTIILALLSPERSMENEGESAASYWRTRSGQQASRTMKKRRPRQN